MKNLLIGVCDNAEKNIDKILLWKKSFESVVDNGEVVLIAFNPNVNDIIALETSNITYHTVTEHSSETVNNLRLLHVYNFLRDNRYNYSKVLYTDVFDVAFLKDPFQKMDFSTYELFIAGEGILHKEEPWNTDVMNKCFPKYTQLLKDQEIYCSGVIGGTPEQLSTWLYEMNKISLHSKKGHDIEDQAAMNILVHHYLNNQLKKFNVTDNWCLHMATGGPTEFFESWGFKTAILRNYNMVPKWKDYDIVHQFNRVPNIHKQIKEMYEL